MGDVQKAKNVTGDMIQNSTVHKNTAMDEIRKLMESGNAHDALNFIVKLHDVLGTYHPYYPHFTIGFKIMNNRTVLYSKPLSADAMTNQRPYIKGHFKFSEKYSDFQSVKDIFEYSYNTQTDIDIDIITLKKMIGDSEDPFQDEIEVLLANGDSWKIKHEEFPAARPYKIILMDTTLSFDFILLRVVRIDGNRVFLSNEEQDISHLLEFAFDLSNFSMNVKISIREKYIYDYNAQLKYLQFMKYAAEEKTLQLFSLEDSVEMASGTVDGFDYQSNFGNIDTEIAFVQSILTIEKKFKTKIIVPEVIDKQSFENIMYLATGIIDGKVSGHWDKIDFSIELTNEGLNKLESYITQTSSFKIESDMALWIFGVEYRIPQVIKCLNRVRFANAHKLKKKINVLDKGDTIRVTLLPDGDNTFIDEINFEPLHLGNID